MSMDVGGGISILYHPFCEGRKDSRALLSAAAARHTGISALRLGPVATAPKGKPYFIERPHLHFSITHSASWWMCAFSCAPLGLDLQVRQSYVDPSRLSRRFFHPDEDAFLSANSYRDFFDLWSAKESWVKYTGRGFYDPLSTFCVVSPDGRFPALAGVELQLIPFADGYSLCLCAERISQIKLTAL